MRASILLLCVCTLLPPTVSDSNDAAEPVIYLPATASVACGGYDRMVMWLDQPQFFEGVASSEVIDTHGLSSEVANDFIIEPAGTIRKVSWWGVYWNGFEGTPICTGFVLRFYMDAECRPEADPFVEYPVLEGSFGEVLAPGGDGYSQFMYDFCLDFSLETGHYWLSVQAVDHEFPPQWGRLGSCEPMPQICPSCVRGEYFGQAQWVPLVDLTGADYDASQMLEDECVHSPTKVLSWGAVKGLYRR